MTKYMGTREVSRAGQRRIILIFFLIVNLQVVASQRSVDEATAEAPPFPPSSAPNFCPHNRLLQLLESSKPSKELASPPSAQDGADLPPVSDVMGNQELSSAKLTEAVVLALLTSRKDEGKQWEILLILILPPAVWALFFCENPLRNLYPRLANVLELLLEIFYVNGIVAFLLPAEWLWVPALCLASSLVFMLFSLV